MPILGPVLGLVFLLVGLRIRSIRRNGPPQEIDDTEIGRTANRLLQVLALLFVPAGAGVIQHLGLLGEHGVALLLALLGSTVLTLVVTVFVFTGVGRMVRAR